MGSQTLHEGENFYLSMTRDGLYALQVLLAHAKPIHRILTLPPQRSGPVSDYADFRPLGRQYRVPVSYIASVSQAKALIADRRPNTIFVNGWSQLLPEDVIAIPCRGCVGTHPSILPRNRGRAPIAWHFINEEPYGGVTLFFLDGGCDSGPIIAQQRFRILKTDNASSYYQRITEIGAKLLLRNFDRIVSGRCSARAQDETKATYLLRRFPADSRIDFSKPARLICNLVRAVADIYPLAFFTSPFGTIRVLSAVMPRRAPPFSGKPGQIARVFSDRLWVMTGKGLVEFRDGLSQEGKVINFSLFRTGTMLNE